MKQDKSIDLGELVKDFFSQCRVQEVEKSDDPLDLKMTWRQVKELSSDKTFIVGGHTHRHMNLAFLDYPALEAEVKISIDYLEQNTGIDIRHYSYPEGLDYCYSDETISVLKKYGIICCPTAKDGINKISESPFHLKRVTV